MNKQFENSEQNFSKAAALIGEKSRAIMLWNLLDGRAYTATELAACANISRQTCSNHLLKLVEANILSVVKQGRYKYYKFANDKIAQALENLAYLLPSENLLSRNREPVYNGIKYARTCYDHLAGKVAVQLTDVMISGGLIIYSPEKFIITVNGEKWFNKFGINLSGLRNMKRKFAYPCLDWSERRNHIGGALGAAFLKQLLENDWIRKKEFSREVIITGKGKTELSNRFKIEL